MGTLSGSRWRDEGNGPTDTREAGPTAVEEFTYLKTVYVDYSGRLQKAQIDTQRLTGKG